MGREIALALVRQGASVVVNDLGVTFDGRPGDRDSAARVAAELNELGGRAVANADSVATIEGAERLIKKAVDSFGGVDILINNAAIVRDNDFWKVAEEDWDDVVNTDLKAAFLTSKFAVPIMCAQQGGGVIINMSSSAGFGAEAIAPYAAAKEGLVGLTLSMARELGRFGILCYAVRPAAATETNLAVDDRERRSRWARLQEVLDEEAPRFVPPLTVSFGEVAPPDRVGEFVTWLCTDESAGANGRTFWIHGNHVGLFARPSFEKDLHLTEGWNIGTLDEMKDSLLGGAQNDYALNSFPDLKVFEA